MPRLTCLDEKLKPETLLICNIFNHSFVYPFIVFILAKGRSLTNKLMHFNPYIFYGWQIIALWSYFFLHFIGYHGYPKMKNQKGQSQEALRRRKEGFVKEVVKDDVEGAVYQSCQAPLLVIVCLPLFSLQPLSLLSYLY